MNVLINLLITAQTLLGALIKEWIISKAELMIFMRKFLGGRRICSSFLGEKLVKIKKSNQGVPWVKITIGILACIYSISNYIVVPEAMTSMKLSLVLGVFLMIIVGMLFGLVLFT